MIKNVLIVDDDQEMLLSLKEGFEKYDETFLVTMAGDGLIAMEKLKKENISLVVTDLKMPRMNGFNLLAHIMEHYPDIPVIIITAYGTPEMERLAREGGAVGYIEKPFLVENLAKKVMTTLRKESDGGTLHGVSSGMFLQLVEVEQKTCTIRVNDKASGKNGVLFFLEGELLDARSNGVQGEAAALEIFSWDEVSLSIQNVCTQKKKKIEKDLQAILLEAMRVKDEAGQEISQEVAADEVEVASTVEEEKPEKPDFLSTVRSRLETNIGERCGLEDIYEDSVWNDLVSKVSEVGAFFKAGKLHVAYLDKGEPADFILLPGKEVTVLSVSPKCPRDRIIQVLSS